MANMDEVELTGTKTMKVPGGIVTIQLEVTKLGRRSGIFEGHVEGGVLVKVGLLAETAVSKTSARAGETWRYRFNGDTSVKPERVL